MKQRNIKNASEKAIAEINAVAKHIKTEKIIDMLISESLRYGYVWSNQECIRAFTETDCEPFNINDLAFRKAEKSCGVDDLLETMGRLVAEKRIDEAIELSRVRTKMRDELLSRFSNLLYYKKGGK